MIDLESALKLPPLKLSTIYNAILESNIDYSNPQKLSHSWFQPSSSKPFRLIIAGRLDPQKGIVEFIDIFKRLEKDANIKLHRSAHQRWLQ